MKIDVKSWNNAVMKALNMGAEKFNPAFFNRGNSFTDWAGYKLPQDIKKRGLIEGVHDLSNPILTHPKISRYAEPAVSNARVWATKLPVSWYGTPVKRAFGLPNMQPKLNYSIQDANKYENYPMRSVKITPDQRRRMLGK